MSEKSCEKINERSCIDCALAGCREPGGLAPDFCVGRQVDSELLSALLDRYLNDPQVEPITQAAAQVEGAFYGQMTRVEEILEFARRLGAQRLGIAVCVGLLNEGRLFAQIARAQGFSVYGVCCKAGSLRKDRCGIAEEYIMREGENICNPLLQARILQNQNTQLNVVIGLCVGHDSLFYRASAAPCTTLVVKDRVLGHNPAAALYTLKSYYKKLLT